MQQPEPRVPEQAGPARHHDVTGHVPRDVTGHVAAAVTSREPTHVPGVKQKSVHITSRRLSVSTNQGSVTSDDTVSITVSTEE